MICWVRHDARLAWIEEFLDSVLTTLLAVPPDGVLRVLFDNFRVTQSLCQLRSRSIRLNYLVDLAVSRVSEAVGTDPLWVCWDTGVVVVLVVVGNSCTGGGGGGGRHK